MPPVQVLIAASSALLLTCCVCLSTAQQPSPTAQTGIFTVVRRTGTEAIRAKFIVDDYICQKWQRQSRRHSYLLSPDRQHSPPTSTKCAQFQLRSQRTQVQLPQLHGQCLRRPPLPPIHVQPCPGTHLPE